MPANSQEIDLDVAVAKKISCTLSVWGKKHYQEYPWRNPEEPWQGLIAEVLLQRTRADNVVPVFNAFIRRYNSLAILARAPVDEIEAIIFSLGLHWRAPLLKKLALQLCQSGGVIPTEIKELIKLPGVGSYIASAWLSFHAGKRSVIIDSNIVRFICRIKAVDKDGETRRKKWLIDIAERLTPEKQWKNYNYAVLDFTMQICTPVPKCLQCPFAVQICATGRKYVQKGANG